METLSVIALFANMDRVHLHLQVHLIRLTKLLIYTHKVECCRK